MENEKIILPAQRIKDKIIRWYLLNQHKTIEEITGNEVFTVFDKISNNEKESIISQMNLNKFELPALLMRVRQNNWILCTTENFININNEIIDRISYQDFCGNDGFIDHKIYDGLKIDLITGEMIPLPKADGYIMLFGLGLSNGEIRYWEIPTGRAGFSFWNVSNKFDAIGRRNQIAEYLEDNKL